MKAEVYRRGTTLSALAKAAGLDPSAVRVALIRPYPAAERVISEFLGVPLGQLWPSRYDSQGRPRRQADTSRQNTVGSRRNSVAA